MESGPSSPGSPPSVLAMKKWKCIYPSYINSKKTVVEGRRIRRDKCVENPTCQEIKDVLDNAGFRTVIEKKFYSREYTKEQGRVRVELLDEQEQVINPEFPHKLSVLHYLGTTIPKLKGRTSGAQGGQSAGTSQAQGGSKGGAKPKGKGKKR
ncbi:putative Signal recognition particle 19 kDa protein [Hypsibius exemplaris]|uniref:Signal recognition particle 19 kDa protein n=1 Tax=Hypsibius exemplaris TaxID=2072580 RepID=A0A1W0XAW6_HYPEX|nr:putative Signal recognition particle 19 kDa protein [Hypsibius exemplaris]